MVFERYRQSIFQSHGPDVPEEERFFGRIPNYVGEPTFFNADFSYSSPTGHIQKIYMPSLPILAALKGA